MIPSTIIKRLRRQQTSNVQLKLHGTRDEVKGFGRSALAAPGYQPKVAGRPLVEGPAAEAPFP